MLVLLGSDCYSHTNSLLSLFDMNSVIIEGFTVRILWGAGAVGDITVFYRGCVTNIALIC